MAIDTVYKGNSLGKLVAKAFFFICVLLVGVSCGALVLNDFNWKREEATLSLAIKPLVGMSVEEALDKLSRDTKIRGFKISQSSGDIWIESPNRYTFIGCSGWPAAMLTVRNRRVTVAKLASHQACL